MKQDLIKELFEKFEAACYEINSVECWSARELQVLLGYSKWENFEKVIEKARYACTNAGESREDHFPDVRKVILHRDKNSYGEKLNNCGELSENAVLEKCYPY